MSLWLVLIAVGLLFLGAGTLSAQLINVDFNQNNGANWGGGGPECRPDDDPARPCWRERRAINGTAINVNSGTNLPLKYSNGSAPHQSP